MGKTGSWQATPGPKKKGGPLTYMSGPPFFGYELDNFECITADLWSFKRFLGQKCVIIVQSRVTMGSLITWMVMRLGFSLVCRQGKPLYATILSYQQTNFDRKVRYYRIFRKGRVNEGMETIYNFLSFWFSWNGRMSCPTYMLSLFGSLLFVWLCDFCLKSVSVDIAVLLGVL